MSFLNSNNLADTVIFFISTPYLSLFYLAYIYLLENFHQFDNYLSAAIGLMSIMFANGPRDMGSIPGQVIPKAQKMVLEVALLNTQYHKVRVKFPWCNGHGDTSSNPGRDWLHFT